jgi:phosphoribosylanthranilate isomerase
MHVHIKICGITNPADAERAAALGADMIGLNFYAKSARCINEATARSILQVLPTSLTPVALFVNESLSFVRQSIQPLNIRTVQLHGDLSEGLPGGIDYIPAFALRDAASLVHITAEIVRLRSLGLAPTAILIDAHVPGQYGGTGQVAPWHLLAGFDPGVPLILAGGLTPDNVAEAIRIVRPYAVDVASGVESAPGTKDHEKMRRFIDAVRNAP